MSRSTTSSHPRISRSGMKALWGAGGALFVGIAAVAVSVSAWAGMVAALLLAAVQFTIAVRLPSDR